MAGAVVAVAAGRAGVADVAVLGDAAAAVEVDDGAPVERDATPVVWALEHAARPDRTTASAPKTPMGRGRGTATYSTCVPGRRAVTAAIAVAGFALIASPVIGCSAPRPVPRLSASAVPPPSPVAAPAPLNPTVAPPVVTTSVPPATTQLTAAQPTLSPRPAASPTTRVTAPRPTGAIGVGQAIVVTAGAYGATTASFSAYQPTGTGRQRVLGPWVADIGYNGMAPPGAKREGDGRTPSGTYGFDFFFGVDANPGARFPYRQVTGPSIVWDDDPGSPLYNQWVDERQHPAGANPEPMDQVPAYDYGAVIGYNEARTPGAGSAIFLHVSTGGPTAGCVSLPASELLQVLRWLDPTLHPTIQMGAG
jgi:L,D-peptidoglycan transpeptidase YkuD (ErfK/YbiS/YcfS/YnhG family)